MTRRAALLLVLVAGPAEAQSVEARLADLRLATAVRLALVADPATRALDVEVTAAGGAVRLSGRNGPDAARVAQGVPGVQSVDGIAGGSEAPVEGPIARPASGSPPPPAPPAARPPVVQRSEVPRVAAPRVAAPPTAAPVSHTVARGDTLFSLARRYATTVEALRALNGLGPRDGIEVGRRLRVR